MRASREEKRAALLYELLHPQNNERRCCYQQPDYDANKEADGIFVFCRVCGKASKSSSIVAVARALWNMGIYSHEPG